MWGTWYDLSRRLCADRRSWTGLPLERNTEALLVAVQEEEILSKEKVVLNYLKKWKQQPDHDIYLLDDVVSGGPIGRVNNCRIVKQKIQHKAHGPCSTSCRPTTVVIHVVYHLFRGLCAGIRATYDWAEILPHLMKVDFLSFRRWLVLKSFSKW